MQWDAAQNAGFSSAEKTWLPVHGNYKEFNVERESKEKDSLLNVIRGLMKIRNTKKSLQEGSLELLKDLHNGVLGYSRRFDNEKVIILLNFDEHEKEFQLDFSNCIFKLTEKDDIKEKAIRLNGFGGVIISSF